MDQREPVGIVGAEKMLIQRDGRHLIVTADHRTLHVLVHTANLASPGSTGGRARVTQRAMSAGRPTAASTASTSAVVFQTAKATRTRPARPEA